MHWCREMCGGGVFTRRVSALVGMCGGGCSLGG